MPTVNVQISDLQLIKNKVLNWLKKFSTFCFLDNQSYTNSAGFEFLAGAGVKREISGLPGKRNIKDNIIFGHIGYEYGNEIFRTTSNRPNLTGFPLSYFFLPEITITCKDDFLTIEAQDAETVLKEIESANSGNEENLPLNSIKSRVSRDEYISTVRKLKDHIHRGDCYEINYCLEFYSEETKLDPVNAYKKLAAVSPNPFSAFYRVNDSWLICASPERFLKREGSIIISQPIKGTAARYPLDQSKDAEAAVTLAKSEKDKSENVMVVDLVRNDLSIICEPGTVQVDELFGIYAFPQVYQMISTVSGKLRNGISFAEIIHATFPMGSMTGAPKKRVMELIEKYEVSARSIFSGTVGYIGGNGDFDFNVVIRSLMYNAATGYLSFMAGSGLTFYSDPEKEWEECLLKAEAIRRVLTGQQYVN
jgi:para-aminobenzoate synthetase component 1